MLKVAHDSLNVLVLHVHAPTRAVFIRIQRRSMFNMRPDLWCNRVLLPICNDARAHTAHFLFGFAFQNSKTDCLVISVTTAALALHHATLSVDMHIAGLAADERLIYFYFSAKHP